ncbi:MAG TPA: hypothetical protein PKU97_12920 [Kofleriaceae bacterium]|nr:hypothetical protein [Kofleriaceae bacterium]
MVLACGLAALTANVGCSLSLQGPSPGRPKHEVPRCDTGKGLLVLDSAMGAVTGMVAVSLLGGGEGGPGAIFGILSAASIGAAVRGNSEVNRCRAALDSYEKYVRGEAPVNERASRATTRAEILEAARRKVAAGASTGPAATAISARPASSASSAPSAPSAPSVAPRPARPAVATAPAAPVATRPATPASAPPVQQPVQQPVQPSAPATSTAPRATTPSPPATAKEDSPWSDFWREEP